MQRTRKNRKTQYYIGVLVILAMFGLVVGSCKNPKSIYQKSIDIAQKKWYADSSANFVIDIPDEKMPYNIYYNIRNTVSYQYYNLYVNCYLEDANGKVIDTQLQDIKLMDDKTGEPFGNGMGDVFEHQLLALKNYKFKNKGKYTFKIKQYMRHNPLNEIISVGILIEKSK